MRISKRRILRRESRKWNFWRLVRILFLLFPAAFLTTSLPCSIEVSGVPLSQHIRKLRAGKWRAAMIQYAALASYQYISQFSSNRCRYISASKSERVEGWRAPSLRRCLSYQQEKRCLNCETTVYHMTRCSTYVRTLQTSDSGRKRKCVVTQNVASAGHEKSAWKTSPFALNISINTVFIAVPLLKRTTRLINGKSVI